MLNHSAFRKRNRFGTSRTRPLERSASLSRCLAPLRRSRIAGRVNERIAGAVAGLLLQRVMLCVMLADSRLTFHDGSRERLTAFLELESAEKNIADEKTI